MKKVILSLVIMLGVCSVFAQNKRDIAAIKQMCGCYEVKFNFAETFAYPKDTANYKPSKTKHEVGLEWVQLVEESPKKIVLQHLLIVGDTMVIKHWRQDWLYENTDILSYNGFNDWKKVTIPKSEVKGQWTQKVYQVDDSPRYEGSGSWIHKDGKTFWESTSYAPLPRREFTQRNDYNILIRNNRHEITKYGWLHLQDNDKIVRDEKGSDYLLAQEKGIDTYTKLADNKCELAQKWWKENQQLWAKVRQKWNTELATSQYIKLKKKIDEKPAFMHLFDLKTTASQAEVNKAVDNFFEVKK
jgi:hypothetical protein